MLKGWLADLGQPVTTPWRDEKAAAAVTRLFVAVWPPAHVVDAVTELVPARPGLRRVPPHQLHVTLRFLGDADVEAVRARLDGAALAGGDRRARPGDSPARAERRSWSR